MTNECRDLNEFEKKASMLLKNVRKIGKFREGNATSPLRGTTNIDINSMVDDCKERFSIKCRKKKRKITAKANQNKGIRL